MNDASPILSACLEEFRKYKALAESAFAQLEERDFHFKLNPQQNSIAAIIKHLAGNMRSRWTDFLTSDGEKPGRDRESEFVDDFATPGGGGHARMMRAWEEGWACLFAALEPLSDGDLGRTVYIRGEPHTVFRAINRQTAHYAQHVGQILVIAKHVKGAGWRWLTIPPGGSEAFNRKMGT